jgi:uncharacterized protein (DUF305 family)
MTVSRNRFRPFTALLLILVAACAGGQSSAAPAPASPANLSPAEIESLYEARLDSARMHFTEADTRFMQGMIHHHAQAVEMGRLAPTNGAGQSVQTLAARIINSQRDEIAIMQRWLRDRGQMVPEVHITDDHVMVEGHGHEMHMPGMLAPEQLRELAAAHGSDFDRLFLTYMIQHHQGAVTMVHDLFGTDGALQDEAAFKIASDVQVDQKTEIARMQRMLDVMSGR